VVESRTDDGPKRQGPREACDFVAFVLIPEQKKKVSLLFQLTDHNGNDPWGCTLEEWPPVQIS
jgi:hypothetical protein